MLLYAVFTCCVFVHWLVLFRFLFLLLFAVLCWGCFPFLLLISKRSGRMSSNVSFSCMLVCFVLTFGLRFAMFLLFFVSFFCCFVLPCSHLHDLLQPITSAICGVVCNLHVSPRVVTSFIFR